MNLEVEDHSIYQRQQTEVFPELAQQQPFCVPAKAGASEIKVSCQNLLRHLDVITVERYMTAVLPVITTKACRCNLLKSAIHFYSVRKCEEFLC